ncbi:POLG alternative reading frame-like [Struthio camelus]|uniref:POLG alternative reading frame-like n=1 Tax=Struthio camelus TaxID=8801 RepID=UPI003603B5CE
MRVGAQGGSVPTLRGRPLGRAAGRPGALRGASRGAAELRGAARGAGARQVEQWETAAAPAVISLGLSRAEGTAAVSERAAARRGVPGRRAPRPERARGSPSGTVPAMDVAVPSGRGAGAFQRGLRESGGSGTPVVGGQALPMKTEAKKADYISRFPRVCSPGRLSAEEPGHALLRLPFAAPTQPPSDPAQPRGGRRALAGPSAPCGGSSGRVSTPAPHRGGAAFPGSSRLRPRQKPL